MDLLIPRCLIFGVGILLLPSCILRSSGPKVLHPVSGSVNVNGKPADDCRIFFEPIDASHVPRCYQVRSGHFQSEIADGLTVTSYRVFLAANEPEFEDLPVADKNLSQVQRAIADSLAAFEQLDEISLAFENRPDQILKLNFTTR